MLVLSRREGEAITLKINGMDIFIDLVEIRGSHAKLGITAPEEVVILREELLPGQSPTLE